MSTHNVGFFLKSVGLELSLEDMTGPGTRGRRLYRLRARNAHLQTAVSYPLTLSELSLLHSWINQELWKHRKNLSRRSDGIFDPFRQQAEQPEDDAGNSPGNAPDDAGGTR